MSLDMYVCTYVLPLHLYLLPMNLPTSTTVLQHTALTSPSCTSAVSSHHTHSQNHLNIITVSHQKYKYVNGTTQLVYVSTYVCSCDYSPFTHPFSHHRLGCAMNYGPYSLAVCSKQLPSEDNCGII